MGAFHAEDGVRQTRGIRLTFDDTATGKIYVTNFRASRRGVRSIEDGDSNQDTDASAASSAADGFNVQGDSFNAQADGPTQRVIENGNVIENVQYVASTGAAAAAEAASGNNGTVRFTVWSPTSIPVGNELPTMSIGSVQCDGSYVDGSTNRMMFECPADALTGAEGQPITVRGSANTIWKFGTYSR
jgi:hypothetical protein